MGSPLDRFLERFPDARRQANGKWEARCPAHDDQHASFGFWWVDGAKPHVAVSCQRGCTRGQILVALGMVWTDLYQERPAPTGGAAPFHISRCYDYRDAGGVVVCQKVRLEPKDFRQRRPWQAGVLGRRVADDGSWSPSGPWVWGTSGCPPVLYRLPELLAGIAAGQRVYLCEGEKDAEALVALGLLATTNIGGAGKWLPEYTQQLEGAEVVILPDNDVPGQQHAERVSWALRGRARSVRVVELPGLGLVLPQHGGDVFDWLAAGGDAAQLDGLVAVAPIGRFRLTDLGNGERLVGRHGADLRYVPKWKRWLVWDGTRWARDETAEVYRRASETVRSLYIEAARCEEDDARKKLVGWALGCESGGHIDLMVKRAAERAGMPIVPEALDADPWLLNCVNGVVDLRTGELRAHRREDLMLKRVNVEFRGLDAAAPRWERFLREVQRGEEDVVSFLGRAFGYGVTGITSERCMFILWGASGRNGKTTLMETVGGVVGDYGASVPVGILMAGDEGRASARDLVKLPGARFVWTSETREGRSFNEERIKVLCGGRDTLHARHLYSEEFDFKAEFKVFLATNPKPELRGLDQALRDKLILIPFEQRFFKPDEEPMPRELPVDPELEVSLEGEGPGILAWLVRGCLEWQAKGLRPPASVRAATAAYFSEMDVVGSFLDECCECRPGDMAAITASSVLYRAYVQHTEGQGGRPMTATAFGRRLTERGLERSRGGRGSRWHGVMLLDSETRERGDGGVPTLPGLPEHDWM